MNEKLIEALEEIEMDARVMRPYVGQVARLGKIARGALAASKQEPQAQAGEPKTLEWMEQPRHIADAATIRLLTEAIAKKDAALKACVEALESYSKSPYVKKQHPKRHAAGNAAITQAKEAMK